MADPRKVRFAFGSDFSKVTSPDADTLYFVINGDSSAIYKGSQKLTYVEAKKEIGDLTALKTTAKDTLVNVVNEIFAIVDPKADVKTVGTVNERIKTAIDALTAADVEITTIADLKVDDGTGTNTQKAAENVQEAIEALNTKVADASKAAAVGIKKLATANAGYAASYQLQQNGVDVKDAVIDIPKDFLVRSAEVKVAATGDAAIGQNAIAVGDTYIDFVINAKDNSDTESHLYVNASTLVKDFTVAKNATEVQLDVTDARELSATLVDDGVTTTKIKNKNVTKDKLTDELQESITRADNAIHEVQINGTALTPDTTDPDKIFVNYEPKAADAHYKDAVGHVGDVNYEPAESVADALTRIDGVIGSNGKLADKADKKVPAAENNIAILDKDGNLADGGKTITELEDGLKGDTTKDDKDSATIAGAKKYADDAVATALTWGTF